MCVKLYDLRYFFSPVCSVLSSCSVRRPIGFRSPSDRIPSAVRSDSVRRPMISVELLVCANRAEKCRYVT